MTMHRNIFLKKRRVSGFRKPSKKYKNLVIQKSDKGNFVVIAGKTEYLGKMETLLKDPHKFEKINLKNDRIVSFAVNQEKRFDDIFKKPVVLIVNLKKQNDP